MKEEKRNLPIGVIDSGVGGISVLSTLKTVLPKENYIYYGDSGNAPYGTKSVEKVRELTKDVVSFLVDKGIKALVVACNTATSAAIEQLREEFCFPVIGMEPAIKPAVESANDGSIIVMATPLTLREMKFINLAKKYEGKKEIIPLPCPGLVEKIEKGIIEGEEIDAYLQNLFLNIDLTKAESIVLGCTHYPFIKNEIAKIVGNGVTIIDGNFGVAKHLKNSLTNLDLLNSANSNYTINFYTSGNPVELIPLYENLFFRAMRKNELSK